MKARWSLSQAAAGTLEVVEGDVRGQFGVPGLPGLLGDGR